MSAWGQKRRFGDVRVISALHPATDIVVETAIALQKEVFVSIA
jgi:hypothetical protein